MAAFTKTAWAKIRDGFESTSRSSTSNRTSNTPAPPYASRTYTFNGDVIIDANRHDPSVNVISSSAEPHRPLFTVGIGLFDVIMLIIMYIVQRGTHLSSDTWIKMGGKYVPCMKRVASSSGYKSQCYAFLFPYQIYRFFTPMFLHGGVTHLLNNLVYQALVGSLLERKYGTKTFAICYILFGFSGNVMSALIAPKSVSVGASGAVYGLLFFCIIDNTLRIFTIKNLQDKIIQFLIMLLVIPYFIMSVFLDVDFSGRIDHAAHGGGALMGILVAMFLCEMPEFITSRVPNGERRIQLIALIAIVALTTCLISAYKQDCAVGPAYWCKSFQNAEDCGAIRHCTDTVWLNDEKYTTADSSTTCEWCQKIIKNTHTGIQHLANNEDLLKSSLAKGCDLFPLATVSSKCTSVVEKYGNSVASLMKNKRYATLCHLMDICSNEPVEETSTTEKPMLLGHKRCTWGPSYWCSSLSNTRECSSIDHCSDKVWSQQSIQKKPNDNICQYCEFTIEKLRVIIQDNKTEINIEKWLSGACSMLPTKESIDECVQKMSQYSKEILVLIQTNIDPGVICHLSHMCDEATVITRVKIDNEKSTEKKIITLENDEPQQIPVDEQSKMLCNVIVSATHDLHANQHKSREEIQTFLKDDCQTLSTTELVQKCKKLVEKHGNEIYGHVASNIELSEVCNYMGDFADHSTLQALPEVHCELCTFVLTTAQYMIKAKHTDDKVLLYIDEQVCSRLTGTAKTNCKAIIETDGKHLIDNLRHGTKSLLLCTRFHVCIDEIISKTNSIEKNEMRSFIKENICDSLGSFKDACNALMENDGTRLMHSLVNDMEGNDLCRLFGICPKKMSLLDNMAINDDKNKCQRCIDDFTRRKHIAEKLVNHSAEFLEHLCGQLPQKDDCIKTVDESISALVNFVRSLDPQQICTELKYCDALSLKQIQPTQIESTDNVISQEIIKYIKDEICSKLGSLSVLCEKTMDTEGPSVLAMIAKDLDPKKACTTMGICSANGAFENCNDKCECCMNKIEIHEVQVTTFLRTMVESIKTLCQRMPGSDKCLEMTARFDANVNKITSQFNAKRVCQLLNHCSTTPVEIETLPQCQTRMDSKKQFLLSSLSTINQNLKTLCEYIPWNKDCYSIIDRSTLDVNEKLTQLNTETACASGKLLTEMICSTNSPFEKLCKQLVTFDENNSRMEALFKSMFNQNGHVEKELCELEQSSDCKTTFKLDNCKDKCDCCVQFYTTKKDYDLKMIETLRNGLLATCDWSLSKDYCISWFNRVCDRMKAKADEFIPTTFCKRMNLCPIEQQVTKVDGDKCKVCTDRLNSRQNHFQTTINEVTTTLSSLCNDNDCRSFVQSAQQQSLNQINKFNSQTYCQRYGYCPAEQSSQTAYMSHLLLKANNHIGSSIEGLDQRLEAALASDICFQYGQLRPMCDHLMSSPQAHRYASVYMALLKNNPKLIDDDLREQMSTDVHADVCQSCKDAVQSSKDFWGNNLEAVRNVLLRTCERCTVKDQCRDYYNQKFDNLKAYLNNIDAAQFCQTIHLCSTSHVTIETDKCSTCVESLQQRKDGMLHGITRVASYFDDLCQRFGGKQCQVFVKQIQDSFEESVRNFDPKQTCSAIGFCSTNSDMDFAKYEKYLEDEFEKNICSTLGPFQSLCKQMIHGNRKQIETIKINYNIKDLMHIGEKKGVNFFTAANLNECSRDKCQCCVDQINQKKECAKATVDNIMSVFIRGCDYCPSKDQCRKYWQDTQTQYDSCIDDIDAKQFCTRLGFCNVSSLCANMGIYQQSCEEALNAYTQSLQYDPKTLEQHLPHTSVVVLPTKLEKEEINDSNSTCILCEYVMNILSSYIHQKSTEEEIEQSLQKVCQDMPATLRSQCHELIDNYGPSIIAVLIGHFDASTVCQKLNLCTKQMKVELSHITKVDQATCGVCDYVSTYVGFALKRDASEKSLEHALSTVCSHLSSDQTSQCQTLVELFRPHIRKLELHLGNNFCKQLAICQTEKDNTNAVKPSKIHVPLEKDDELKRTVMKNLDLTPECTLCHYVVSYLDAVLKTNKSEAAVEAALERVCTILPNKERAQCTEFVKTYGPVLAEMIAEVADPDTICRYLGMCQVSLPKETTTTIKKPTPVTYPNHDYVHLPTEQTEFTCTICKYVVSRMKHDIALNQTEEEIIAAMKKSCDSFSVLNLKQQCIDFVDQYAPYIIQMISSDVDPKVACQSIGLCTTNSLLTPSTHRQSTPSTPVSTSTLYGKCIFGMNYWCTSRQNAELCNAVELCQREVWSKKNKNIVI
ncbi:unnamed protein product [Adineta steineri]|uniref:Rhomboid-like protein n=2 Tax=Adineta steineri TaxID=433720 RepID=A0A814P3L8_9BILA|nr:unnamed protein product [Adineta steineri]